MRRGVLVFLLAGCGSGSSDDLVVGPFTGETHRYTLTNIRLPMSNLEARDYGGDINGDGTADNQLGMAVSTLGGEGLTTQHTSDMIVAGSVPTSLEITADDLVDDPTVGVRYLGTPDSPAVELGGSFVEGRFRSNPAASTAFLGESQLLLPVLDEADPSLLSANAMELILVPNEFGGFTAIVHAAIPTDTAFMQAVHRAFSQMVASNPGGHRGTLALLDSNPKDGVLSYDEVANNAFLVSMVWPDLVIDSRKAISFGFRAYFQPCDAGQCLDSVRFDHCFDRLLDADETDVDCGGTCRDCEGGAACVDASDCETTLCDQGHCGPPSCTDGVRDGLESDIDCGADCVNCATGKRCYIYSDCASGSCGGKTSGDFFGVSDYSAAGCD